MTNRFATMAFLVALGACTQPGDRFLAPIEDIQVPAVRAASDTLYVDFTYTFGGCETDGGVSVEKRAGGLEFFALKVVPSDQERCICTDVLHRKPHRHAVPPGDRGDNFTLRFQQPSGTDSVRVVRTQ